MTKDERAYEMIHHLKHFNGRMTRSAMANAMEMDDRSVRQTKQYINSNDDLFEDYFIVSTSDESGYKLADSPEELYRFVFEQQAKIRTMQIINDKAMRTKEKLDEKRNQAQDSN